MKSFNMTISTGIVGETEIFLDQARWLSVQITHFFKKDFLLPSERSSIGPLKCGIHIV